MYFKIDLKKVLNNNHKIDAVFNDWCREATFPCHL